MSASAPATITPPRSHIECLGTERSRCGYCRSRYTSRDFGVWAHRLDVYDYQALLDAGWRRSGAYLYRPDLATTCCPCFVIRLDAAKYTPSASHKRVLKRLYRFAASPALSPASSSVSGVEPPKSPQSTDPPIVPPGGPASPATPDVSHLSASVYSAISGALDRISGESSDPASFPDRHVVDQARQLIKVFPPRIQGKSRKKMIWTTNGTPIPNTNSSSVQNTIPSGTEQSAPMPTAPVLVSTVAMVLAATERKSKGTDNPSLAACTPLLRQRNGLEQKDIAMSRSTKQKQVCRQMELASIIAKRITDASSHCTSVTVTPPGFLNFWVVDETPSIEDTAIMHESVRADKRAAREGTNIAFLKARLRSDGEARPDKRSRSNTVNTKPLSRVGSEVSSERAGVVPHLPSLATESASASFKKETVQAPTAEVRMQLVIEQSVDNSFTMEFLPSQFRRESYEIFRKYQMSVHREPSEQCGEETYRRFLVDSPLVQATSPGDPNKCYGSFHIMYRIRGRLFAVGVVDILPRCLSSVYLFYDPDFAKLSPGTLSALNEIEWVRKASNDFPSLRFYYMGYYIHSCPKMRYKASYHPSEILCEETKNWIPAADVKVLLESANVRQLRLAPPTMAPAPEAAYFRMHDAELDNLTDESKLQISFGQDGVRIISLRTLERLLPPDYREQLQLLRQKIRRFVSLAGKVGFKFFLHDV